MTRPDPSPMPLPNPHGPSGDVRGWIRPERMEGLTAWALMLGVLLAWFGVLPGLVS